MRFRPAALLFVAAVTACASFASADDLNVGDKAPALKPSKWIKGEPIAGFESGKIYVIDFWASWCGPCKATLPHLTELQTQYKDVVFIAQGVWERDAEQTKVEPFVTMMGDKMNVHVAADDRSDPSNHGVMATTWMEAAGLNTIPTTFIIDKSGTIAWIGHPMGLDKKLEQVVSGKFDLAAETAKAKLEHVSQEEREAAANEFQAKIAKPLREGHADEAAAGVKDLVAAHPGLKKGFLLASFTVFAKNDEYDLAYKFADELAAAADDDADKLNELAWKIVSDKTLAKQDYDRAEKYAARAVELTDGKDAGVLDTLARAYFEKGQKDKAIELQTKAVAIAPEGEKKELQETLDEYNGKTEAK